MATTKTQTRTQIGRKVVTVPGVTPEASKRSRLIERQRVADVQRVATVEATRIDRLERDETHAQRCREIGLLAAGRVGLAPPDVEKLLNTIENGRRAVNKINSANPQSTQKVFDAYACIADRLAQFGHGVRSGSGDDPLATARPREP